MSILIFGHKNPDSDSCIAATALSFLKNKLGEDTLACRLGEVNRETRFIYDHYQVPLPKLIEDVKTQLKDIDYDRYPAYNLTDCVNEVFTVMREKKQRTVAITDEKETFLGIVTMEDIAKSTIFGDIYSLNTSLKHLLKVLEAEEIVHVKEAFKGHIKVISYYSANEKLLDALQKDSIVIVGDRYDVVEMAIERQVELILITGDHTIPAELADYAKKMGVGVISCNLDTYTTAKRISQCNFVEVIMTRDHVVTFVESAYLDVALEEIKNTNFSGYPVVDKNYKYLGLISRRNILSSSGKPVILVDHNEAAQSAEGIEQAEIREIYDHHKIGDVATHNPIHFRNIPVGSTSTIIYKLFQEQQVALPKEIAGLLLSGIISDTLLLTSPTTTPVDEKAYRELEQLVRIDAHAYAKEMFKAGTAIGDSTIEELFFKDYKLFEVSGKKLGIGQIYTLDVESIRAKQDDIHLFLKELNKKHRHHLTMLVVTDIYANGSYLYFVGSSAKALSQTFDVEVKQGSFIPGVVSRKKQIVPKMMNVIIQS